MIETISTKSGNYFGVVFEEAVGRSIPLEEMSDDQLFCWGQSLAELHRLSEAFSPDEATRGSWQVAMDFIASEFRRSPHDRILLLELENLRTQLDRLPAGPRDIGLIHYDFQPDNVFYDDQRKRFSAIDFDDAMVHWYAMDIASATADLIGRDDGDADGKLERFLTGYGSVRELDENFKELLPAFRKFADFYTLARVSRSLEDFEADTDPEWADKLYDKLTKACDRIRARYRPSASLRPVDAGNWYACAQLEVTDEQRHVFPIPPVYWLAESAYCGMSPMAIYAAEQLAGLAVYTVDPDDGCYWIMAFMIDQRFQSLGLGCAGMVELIRYLKEKHGCDRILLGHRPENERAARLYAALGFQEIDLDGREIVRELLF